MVGCASSNSMKYTTKKCTWTEGPTLSIMSGLLVAARTVTSLSCSIPSISVSNCANTRSATPLERDELKHTREKQKQNHHTHTHTRLYYVLLALWYVLFHPFHSILISRVTTYMGSCVVGAPQKTDLKTCAYWYGEIFGRNLHCQR